MLVEGREKNSESNRPTVTKGLSRSGVLGLER